MPWLLIPYPQIDPVLVHIGPLAIRWYALAYIFGILIGWAYARAIVRSGNSPCTSSSSAPCPPPPTASTEARRTWWACFCLGSRALPSPIDFFY